MHLELRHLRTIRAIHDKGGLGRAAEVLNITQSALSHQIRALEAQAGVPMFLRQSRPLRLSPAGLRLLRLAQAVLPQVETVEAEFRGPAATRGGRMHIAIECHACFNWLLPALDAFRRAWPQVDIDIRAGLAFTALPALVRATRTWWCRPTPRTCPASCSRSCSTIAPCWSCLWATHLPGATMPSPPTSRRKRSSPIRWTGRGWMSSRISSIPRASARRRCERSS